MKQIKEFPDYLITDDGRVFSKKLNAFLKPTINNGYFRITLRKNNVVCKKYVHCLLLETFVSTLWNTKLFKQQEIANMFNVSRPTISDIICGRTWRHLWDT